MDRRQVLADSIKKAFQETTHPGFGNVVEPGFACDTERIEVANLYASVAWSELSFGFVDSARWTVSFLTIQGFRYYLPAFLLGALHPRGGDVLDSVLYRLRAPAWRSLSLEDWAQGMDGFSREQRDVVVEFLQWCKDHEDAFIRRDAAAALATYWDHGRLRFDEHE